MDGSSREVLPIHSPYWYTGGRPGEQGVPTWRYLVAALRDSAPVVRRAAVEALWESAASDPARWVHAVFHPGPEVRRHAEQLGAPHGFGLLFPPTAPYEGREEAAP